MKASSWGERFLATTRGRILSLLRRCGRTVNELAEELHLTDNAVRAHLATLERDGLVRQAGTRPGLRRPNLTYELTPAAEQFFPKPHGPVLQQLLTVLADRLDRQKLEDILRTVGQQLAAQYRAQVQAAHLEERVAQMVALLEELGGLAEIQKADGKFLICGFDCPLGLVANKQPLVCRLAETLLAELLGAPVTERCVHEKPPRCLFEVTAPVQAQPRD